MDSFDDKTRLVPPPKYPKRKALPELATTTPGDLIKELDRHPFPPPGPFPFPGFTWARPTQGACGANSPYPPPPITANLPPSRSSGPATPSRIDGGGLFDARAISSASFSEFSLHRLRASAPFLAPLLEAERVEPLCFELPPFFLSPPRRPGHGDQTPPTSHRLAAAAFLPSAPPGLLIRHTSLEILQAPYFSSPPSTPPP